MLTSTPKSCKQSNYVSKKTLTRRNKFLLNHINETSGISDNAITAQA